MYPLEPRSLWRSLVGLWPVALIGFAGVRLPVLLCGKPSQDPFDGPFALVTLVTLVTAGLVAGVIARGRPLLGGLASVLLLPVATVVEVMLDPTSHNLWPLELVMYALLALPAVGAAAVTGAVLRWVPGAAR